VRPHGVVVVPEPIELGLQLRDRGRPVAAGEEPLQRLVEALDLAAGLRVMTSEIEFTMDLGAGDDQLTLVGTAGKDVLSIGAGGAT
jgi:hypothetical protein